MITLALRPAEPEHGRSRAFSWPGHPDLVVGVLVGAMHAAAEFLCATG